MLIAAILQDVVKKRGNGLVFRAAILKDEACNS